MKKPDHITVTIDDRVNSIPVHVEPGELLLDILRKSGKPISAPCGGNGTCGKCSVEINNGEQVLACQYIVAHDLYVTLPNAGKFSILQKSHHSKSIENNSGIEISIQQNRQSVSYKGRKISATSTSTEKYGLAVDIGSTTVVIFLEDLASFEILDVTSFVNPQTAYGGDVISRITHCIENEDGLSNLHSILIKAINSAVNSLAEKNGIDTEQIYKTTIVGNTVMQHILYGTDPRSIAFAPFTPVFVDEKECAAETLQLATHPQAIVKLLPSIAGYVGADIVAGVATTDLLERDAYTLYIDIGTNGEIVLGNRHKIYCCATAAGPAFEGANIKFGIGGITGAVSEYENDEFTTIGNSPAVGICGSGLIDIVATLLDKGLIDMMGYMESDFLVVPQSQCGINKDIVLPPEDIREVQLAKGAIRAGITTLMQVAGIDYHNIERLYLAGGFGNYIRPASAIRIGMLPQELGDKIVPIGNAAGTGARFALKSLAFEKKISAVIEKSEYIELSMRPDFNEAYVTAMIFK